MALYLPIRATNRSSGIRVDGQRILPSATSYVDISKVSVRVELAHHAAIGQIFSAGALTSTNTTARVETGSNVTEGTSSADRSVRVLAGEIRKDDGSTLSVSQQDVTVTPGHATLSRIDSVVIDLTSGTASVVAGTAAASPVAPTLTSVQLRVANINVVPVSGPGGTNEIQTLTVDAVSGTYTLTFGAQTTATIAFNASDTTGATSVRAKLEALSTIGTGNVTVSGGPGASGGGTPYAITFVGTLAETDVGNITSNAGGLVGGGTSATIVQTTPGAPAGIANAKITDVRPRV